MGAGLQCCILFVVGCGTPTDIEAEKVDPVALETTTTDSEYLNDNVVLTKQVPIELEDYKVSIAGYQFDLDSGSPVKDTTIVGAGLINESFDEGFSRGGKLDCIAIKLKLLKEMLTFQFI
ncbi:hypothetical protein PRVXH_001260 [Proteinivorax hydrogeniformans]|uniref:Uncharacterized protein n=1 Tax=Proteinivorax hydrogeniformans TaxID=1826727 RepID=A0AAU8HWZ3_9FIRM